MSSRLRPVLPTLGADVYLKLAREALPEILEELRCLPPQSMQLLLSRRLWFSSSILSGRGEKTPEQCAALGSQLTKLDTWAQHATAGLLILQVAAQMDLEMRRGRARRRRRRKAA